MDQTIFLFHGIECTSQSNFQPWLQEELEIKGYEVINPDLPNADRPVPEEWWGSIKEHDSKLDNAIIIGRSQGATFGLKIMEKLAKQDRRIDKLVSLAGFWSHFLGWSAHDPFFVEPIDLNLAKQGANKVCVLNSDNDPYIPLDYAKNMAEGLDAEFILKPGDAHFSAEKYEWLLEFVD